MRAADTTRIHSTHTGSPTRLGRLQECSDGVPVLRAVQGRLGVV